MAAQAFPDERFRLFVSPSDIEWLKMEGVVLVGDASLSKGDCRVEAGGGVINGSVRRLLEDIRWER